MIDAVYKRTYQPLRIIQIFAFESWAPDFSTKSPEKSSLANVFVIGTLNKTLSLIMWPI